MMSLKKSKLSLALAFGVSTLIACAPVSVPQQQHAPCYVVPIGYVMPYDKYTPYMPCPPSLPATNLVPAVPVDNTGAKNPAGGGETPSGGGPKDPSPSQPSGPDSQESETEAGGGAKGTETRGDKVESSATGGKTPSKSGAHAVEGDEKATADARDLRGKSEG